MRAGAPSARRRALARTFEQEKARVHARLADQALSASLPPPALAQVCLCRIWWYATEPAMHCSITVLRQSVE